MYGRRNPNFFHSRTKWRPILEILMGMFSSRWMKMSVAQSISHTGPPLPVVSAFLLKPGSGPWPLASSTKPAVSRSLTFPISVRFPLRRSRTLLMGLTGIFSDGFIEHLFDLVELTRNVDDESLNYSVIKLIVRSLTSHQSFLD